MITVREAKRRGLTRTSWLESWHTFSFGEYLDPTYREFRALRVINEDFVRPAAGFPTHFHRDMEILTYVMDGRVAHEDSLGNRFELGKGDVQRMTAGSGIEHSEMNPSPEETLHLLQIWIRPNRKSLPPSYEQRHFTDEEKRARLCLVASPDGADDSLRLHQDARVFAGCLAPGEKITHAVPANRGVWAQVAHGELVLNDQALVTGDGAAVEKERELVFYSPQGAEILLFELA